MMGKEAEGTGVGALFDKIDEFVRQGNVRRIVVTDRHGRKVLDVPINAGVVAAVIAPMLMAAGAALALAGGWRIQVEHAEPAIVPGDAEEGAAEDTERPAGESAAETPADEEKPADDSAK